ncbi:MAG: sulfatase-like hydrolase/transferase [Opitutaceae bacterium]|nr:sulfatase-like hydrolase/transferase [Opitutaceae bacterium]
MNNRKRIQTTGRFWTVSLALLFLNCAQWAWAAKQPNIIVIVTDDHGYADLGSVGTEKDVKTPHLDRLAAEGVRFTDGYVSAPQCSPSRAGLLTGRDQNRFGYTQNGEGPLPAEELTIANRLGSAGYVTGMVGKWHLDVAGNDRKFIEQHAPGTGSLRERLKQIPAEVKNRYHPHARGFQETFSGFINQYSATYDLEGNRFAALRGVRTTGDRLDRQSDAAAQFIDHHHKNPFFLYLAYYAPHVPLASSKKYLDRFPRSAGSGQAGDMPTRRRYALAMISAVDDGVGRIMDRLQRYDIDENTLIFFISDNGAPLKLSMEDLSMEFVGGAWDGSKNTPLNGEKGMLAEGGIRVPFLARWKGTIPGGQVCETQVISLDVAATACTIAGLERPNTLDGQNLLPMLTGEKPLAARTLTWRFWGQTAVRQGDWKFLKMGNQQSFLFNLENDPGESKNLIKQHPELAARLEQRAVAWAADLIPSGVPNELRHTQEVFFYNHFFNTPFPEGINPEQNPFMRRSAVK